LKEAAMVRLRLFVAVGVLVLGSISFEAQVPSPSQDNIVLGKQLIGMWRLVSYPQRLADGTTEQNPRSVGYITYIDTSPIRMCWVAMNPNRRKWNRGNVSAGVYTPTSEEAIFGITGLNAYCATVEIHAKEGFVFHHVEIERIPNDVGMTRKRWFTFEGSNRMSLRIDRSELDPPTVETILIFERVR
jgi:hypothetical protein